MYILIVISIFGSSSDFVRYQEFTTKERCEEARKFVVETRDVKKGFKYTWETKCVEK